MEMTGTIGPKEMKDQVKTELKVILFTALDSKVYFCRRIMDGLTRDTRSWTCTQNLFIF